MKLYKIKVNGKAYKVELEAIDETVSAAPVKAEEKKAEPAPAAKAPSGASGQQVPSPIQGTVVGVKVKVGDQVKKGQVLFLVEAMKLENEVVSPFEGTVTEVLVEKGANVTAKQPLAVIG